MRLTPPRNEVLTKPHFCIVCETSLTLEHYQNKIMKALILTRRTRLPASIRLCLNASAISFTVVDVNQKVTKGLVELIKTHILDAHPDLIIIDGEYGNEDARIWTELSKFSTQTLRLRIFSGKNLPESLELLQVAHAVKTDGSGVIIFIEKPSEAVRAELRRIGALWVWPTLHKPSGLESSFYKIITGVHRIANGFKDLFEVAVREFNNEFRGKK